MWDTMEFDYTELDEAEQSYLHDALASGDPDEIERALEYFGRDSY